MKKIHTVFVTYNRLELTKQAVESYLETVTIPYTISIVDNASTDGTQEWISDNACDFSSIHLLKRNRYPGFATNRGWENAPSDAKFFQRADNDFAFLPGWCDEVLARFRKGNVGQVGMRTSEEENHVSNNTGGNCVIRRKLWEQGLRWDERPWGSQYPTGWTEDSYFSPAVRKMGYIWTRVKEPCIRSLASGDWSDPYYKHSYGIRGIRPNPADPTAPGTT